MSDTFDKVNDGQALEISADTWNALLEAGQDYRRRKLPREGGPQNNDPLNPAVRVLVKNQTGATLPTGSVLAVGLMQTDPGNYPRESNRSPLFSGSAPAASSDAFVITLDPLDALEIGRAVILGAVSCDVVISDITHNYATPTPGVTATLASSSRGPARIVYKPSGTGTKHCFLILNGAVSESPWKFTARFKATANIALSTLNAGATVDGGTVAAGDRVVLGNQTTATENGIYDVPASGSATRSNDAATGDQLLGATIYITEGTKYNGTYWTVTNAATIIVGTTSIAIAQTPSASTTVAGYVNLTNQDWLGRKKLLQSTSANVASVSLDPSLSAGAGVTCTSPGATPAVAIVEAIPTAGGNSARVITRQVSGGVGFTIDSSFGGGDPFISMNCSGGAGTFTITYIDALGFGVSVPTYLFDSTSTQVLFCAQLGGGTVYAKSTGGFCVYDGAGAFSYGVDSTGPLGLTIKRGIITAAIATNGIPMQSMADGTAANSTLYYSTTAGKLVYKDSVGAVNNLY